MQVKKAIEISDAKIQFVSLVDKAANMRQFLITKAEDGMARFSTFGKILKVDSATHYLTGIVYEPLIEDAHGNFMTAEEIQKAAYWFAKNGDEVDLQHSFEAASGVSVVENYIAPCDMPLGEAVVAKGTWLITVEVNNPEVWDAVEKGAITGFSMGGLGKYSEEDVDLTDISKTADTSEQVAVADKKGILKRFAEFLGLDVVEKGATLEAYERSIKSAGFWNAFYALEDTLYRYNWSTDRYEFETNEATIREALEEFAAILENVLTQKSVSKALTTGAPLLKAGKKMSSANQKKLDAAYQALAELREELIEDDNETIEKEKIDMTKTEVQELIDTAVAKALEANAAPPAQDNPAAADPTTTEPTVTGEDVQKMIDESITKAIAPILQARGLPSNLNDTKQVEKANDVFAGLFV